MRTRLFLILNILLFSLTFAQEAKEGNGKSAGIAINPVGVLFNWYSLEYNIWQLDRTAEINIPFQYLHNPFDSGTDNYDISAFSLGVQYRKFFNEEQDGFFVQAGYQFLHIGADGKGEYNGDSSSGNVNSVLFGIGYRMISESNNLFWAVALSAGKAWGSVESPDGDEVSDSGLTYDIDLFKIGYAW